MRRLVVAIVVLLALITAPRPALADEAAAREHFKKGIGLYDKKQYAEALTSFQEAYREKPSPGIKQNIALCLKGLGRFADAATAFDEALDEGKDSLKPETRTAIERELTELSKTVATVNITIAGADEKKNAETVISIQPVGQAVRALPPGGHRRPIRLMPGIYTFTAKIPGQADPEPKKFALVTGAPVDATFGKTPDPGILIVKVNVPEAVIKVDGVDAPEHGKFNGPVPPGKHKIDITATGWRPLSFEVTIPANATVENPVTLQPAGEAPKEYVNPNAGPPPKPKRIYLVIVGAIDGAGYRLSDDLDEKPPSGERRGFGGVAAGGRFGYLLARTFAIEIAAEAGVLGAQYKIHPTDAVETKTTITHWQLTPSVRLVTPGTIRFTAGTGVGLHGLTVDAMLARGATVVEKKGKGISGSWLVDAGMQFDVGPLFLEIALFLDVHGVGSVEGDDAPNARFLLGSPSVRGGLRAGLGIPF